MNDEKKIKLAGLGYWLHKRDPKMIPEIIQKHRERANYLEIGADASLLDNLKISKIMDEDIVIDDTIKNGYNLFVLPGLCNE